MADTNGMGDETEGVIRWTDEGTIVDDENVRCPHCGGLAMDGEQADEVFARRAERYPAKTIACQDCGRKLEAELEITTRYVSRYLPEDRPQVEQVVRMRE